MRIRRQFLRFSLIGCAGFIVDVASLYLLRELGLDLYSARLLSFTLAVTFTWIGNRHYTFGVQSGRRDTLPGEWFRYFLSMSFGGLLNYGVYAVLITGLALAREHPWLAVAAGTGAGLVLNFVLARRLLYQRAS